MRKELKIESRDIGGGRYEVEGVIMYAETHAHAIRKYLRKKKPTKVQSDNTEEHF